MSTPTHPETPEQPGALKRPWWKTPKGIAGIVAALLVVGIIGSCNDDTDDTTAGEETTTQTTVVEETTVEETTEADEPTTEAAAETEITPEEETVTAGQDKAAEYEAWLKGQFGVDSFIEVLMQDSTLWAGYISGIEAKSDRMHVRLQVDRSTPDGQALGERAAKAIASLIRLGDDPRVNDVDWVVVEDGAGTYISQESV